MTNSIFLDVGIGLVLMYLIVSLYCTIVQEFIAQFFSWRAKNLTAAITHLVGGVAGVTANGKNLGQEVLDHPLVRIAGAKIRASGAAPSYVSAANFAMALAKALQSWHAANPGTTVPAPQAGTQTGQMNIKALQDAVDALPNGAALKAALVSILDQAQGDWDNAIKGIGDWFDAAMERASGWYKRNVKWWLLGLGFVFAVLVNADTIQIVVRLSDDASLRATVAAYAATVAPPATVAPATGQTADQTQMTADQKKAAEEAKKKADAEKAKADAAYTKLHDTVATRIENGDLATSFGGLPIGWSCYGKDKVTCYGDGGAMLTDPRLAWIVKMIGLILTGLMASLGAPFWFGLLQQLNAIRGTGDKPATKTS